MQREQGTLGEIWEKERAGNGAGTKEGQKEKNSRFACKYTKNGIIKENQKKQIIQKQDTTQIVEMK